MCIVNRTNEDAALAAGQRRAVWCRLQLQQTALLVNKLRKSILKICRNVNRRFRTDAS